MVAHKMTNGIHEHYYHLEEKGGLGIIVDCWSHHMVRRVIDYDLN